MSNWMNCWRRESALALPCLLVFVLLLGGCGSGAPAGREIDAGTDGVYREEGARDSDTLDGGADSRETAPDDNDAADTDSGSDTFDSGEVDSGSDMFDSGEVDGGSEVDGNDSSVDEERDAGVDGGDNASDSGDAFDGGSDTFDSGDALDGADSGETDAPDGGCVPRTEVCDGVDNDCNDLIDDGIVCDPCAEVDCGYLTTECTLGVCDPDGQCRAEPMPSGTACGDPASSECDSPDTCDGLGSCQPNYVSAGTACDDGLFCNDGEACDGAGSCAGGAPRDCSAWADQCNEGLCDEGGNSCYASPINEEQPCDDGLFCMVGERCYNGFCGGGTVRDCDDGLFCNGLDYCSEFADSCEHLGDPCPGTECGSCQEDTNTCFTPSGTACGDPASSQCDQPDTCNGLGTCRPNYVSSGTACDDGLFCNDGEACDGAGSCAGGAPRDCSAWADQCNEGLCDEGGNSCYAIPDNEGLACDDGEPCTTSETCQSGSCSGVVDKDTDLDTYIDDLCPLGTDCDDADNQSYPGAPDTVGDGIDQNCDGVDGIDADSDGFASIASGGGDCDDADPASYPGAPELCDGNDNACVGSVPPDEVDNDLDYYVECAAWNDTQGDNPAILGGGDCDDSLSSIYPGAVDRLDTVDQNCDGYDGESVSVYGFGEYLDIVLDSANKVHIFTQSLYITNVSGSWTNELIDSNGGLYTSLAIDSLDNLHVSYQGIDGLRYATNASGSWVVTTVASGGGFTSIALDDNDKAHISYDSGSLSYATNQSGSWSIEKVNTDNNSGWYTSIIVNSNGSQVDIVDSTIYAAEHSTNAGGSWNTTPFDGALLVEFVSAAADALGNLYVSYGAFVDSEGFYRLRHATNKSGSWVVEEVDTTAGAGLSTSIAVDGAGRTHISYVNRVTHKVMYATNKGGGFSTWTTSVVGDANQTVEDNFITAITLDASGNPHIAYYGGSPAGNCWGDLCYAH